MADPSTSRTAISFAIAAAALSFVATPAGADRADWAPALSRQILEDHHCVVAFLSQVVERRVGDREVVIAKVHCEDDRAFDAFRDSPIRRFDITECDQPNEEAC